MKAKIVFYSQKHLLPKQKTLFKKELSGHNDSSHGGKYKYRIKGLLDNIPFIKPCNSALIIKQSDYSNLISLLNKYDVKYVSYAIILPQSDFIK